MADPNADLLTGNGLGNATLDDLDTGFLPDAEDADAAAQDDAAIEDRDEGNPPDEYEDLQRRVRAAEDRAAGHKGEATQAKRRAQQLEQENEALRRRYDGVDQKLAQLERRLTERDAEVAQVNTTNRQQAFLRDRIAYWENEGYANELARTYANNDLRLMTQYEQLEADRRRIEEEKVTIAQQKQEAALESVIANEVREAIADAKADGLTIRLSLTEAKEAVMDRYKGRRFNEADVARVVAKLARDAAKEAERQGAKQKNADTRAGNRQRAITEGPEFEDGGTAGLSFNELEERMARGDLRVFDAYEKALQKQGYA